MLINKITQTFVGADLSRTSPIYRPPVTVHDNSLHVLIAIVDLPHF
jgi:hypothetical protein